MIRLHALTVLPSVSSLQTLRHDGKPSGASKAMIGFGNPLLDGGPYVIELREQINTTCPVETASISDLGRVVGQIATDGRPADVAAQLLTGPPLSETADESCAVAKDLRVDASDIHLGRRRLCPRSSD